MANKTADQILSAVVANELHYTEHRTDCRCERLSHAQASRQLFEATMEIIGEDEAPDTKTFTRASLGGKREYKPAYSLRALTINNTKAELRAKARAFYGITETDQGGE